MNEFTNTVENKMGIKVAHNEEHLWEIEKRENEEGQGLRVGIMQIVRRKAMDIAVLREYGKIERRNWD